MDRYNWEEFLYRLGKRGEPADFKAFMSKYATDPTIDPEMWVAMYPMIAGDDVGRTMFAAVLQLPPDEADSTLGQIARVLPRASFRKRLNKELSSRQQRWHQQAMRVMRYTVIPGISGLVAMFRAYLHDRYDLDKDPNQLIREASARVDEDEEYALRLVGEAGALALRGKLLWHRWPDEAPAPVDNWFLVLNTFVDRVQHEPEIYPLGPIEEERTRWRETLQALEEIPQEEIEERESPRRIRAHGELLFDELAPLLYGDVPITAKTLAELPHPAEEYAELVVHSVRDWDSFDFSEPGTEELLIDMMTILGAAQYTDGIDSLTEVVAATADSELIEMAEEAANALALMGEPALEPMLDFLRYSFNDPARIELTLPVAQVGRGDARVYDVLVQLFDEVDWHVGQYEVGKANVAFALGTLGDERAVPLLEAALDAPAADDFDRELIEEALESLGAEST